MSDVPTDPPLSPAEELRAVRERARLARIEAHRLKAEHARLVAANEDAAADRLISRLDDPNAAPVEITPIQTASERKVTAEPKALRPALRDLAPPSSKTASWPQDASRPLTPPRALSRQARRKTSPWMASFALHGIAVVALGLLTFVTLNREPPTLIATSFDGPEILETDISSIDIEQVTFDELSVEPVSAELPLEDTALDSLELAELFTDTNPSTTPGFAELVPDVGSLLSGAGESAGNESGGGRKGGGDGAGGSATFFGAEARGDRFAFVVDNSGSMQRGRLETTLLELGRSVSSLKPDQYFYVVFYSDQAYPMFYPEPATKMLPATRENQQRLGQWLSTVEMCTGGNLADAMELVVPLKPSAVYLLSDGAMGQPNQPKTLAMRMMTEANDWPFVIHTLGMGVPNAFAANNLLEIAQAHRGAFAPVTVHPAAVQQAKLRPIRYNREPGPVWGSKTGGW